MSRRLILIDIAEQRPTGPVVVTGIVADGTVDDPYATTIAAGGGVAPYVFALFDGELPPGLVLEANGSLSGVPAAAGSFSFTIAATDVIGNRGRQTFPMDVDP